VNKVTKRMVQGRDWIHNFHLSPKGRIWLPWRPKFYKIQLISMSEQHIHCKVCQMHDLQSFLITMVYGLNHESQRQELWHIFREIATNMEEAWCVVGDFKSILYIGDRIGGTEVHDHEVKHFFKCIYDYGLQEMRYKGPYFSWTNKIVWSRIDRAFVNPYWFTQFDYGQVTYLPNGLSDHSVVMVKTTKCHKRKPSF